MQFTQTIASAILIFAVTGLTAPVPQLAGEGAALDSIFSSTDNGIGYGIEDAEENTAKLISGSKSGSTTGAGSAPPPAKRQLAGEGAALNSIFSSTDNGIGYGIEDAEDNTAKLLSGSNSGSTGSNSASPPPPPPAKRQLAGEGAAANSILSSTDNGIGYGIEDAEDNIAKNIAQVKSAVPSKRQLDKVANGLGAIGSAAGINTVTDPVVSAGDSIDGTLTSGAANAGAQVGSTEVSTLEGIGSAIPKRQLDKVANGLGAIGSAAGINTVTDPAVSAGDSIDGTLTSGAADAGAKVGDTEVSTLEAAGSAIPRRQLDKIANGLGAVGSAAGANTVTNPIVAAGDSVDGTLTSGAANAGAQIGDTEVSTLEGVGSAVPRH